MCTMHVACHFLCLAAIYSQCSRSTRGSSASSSLVRRRRWRKGKLMTFSLFVCCCCVCCDRMWAFNVTFWVDVCLFCYVCQAANNMCGSGSQKQHKKLLHTTHFIDPNVSVINTKVAISSILVRILKLLIIVLWMASVKQQQNINLPFIPHTQLYVYIL